MGQQQLILLVIAVVIVGVATVVGIQAFQDNKVKSSVDALTQDLVRMASDAQAWKQKPSPFGGQGQSCTGTPEVCTAYADVDFTGLNNADGGLSILGYKVTGTAPAVYENLNGVYAISTDGTTTGLVLTGCNGLVGTKVSIQVDGTLDTNIESKVSTNETIQTTVTACAPGTGLTF